MDGRTPCGRRWRRGEANRQQAEGHAHDQRESLSKSHHRKSHPYGGRTRYSGIKASGRKPTSEARKAHSTPIGGRERYRASRSWALNARIWPPHWLLAAGSEPPAGSTFGVRCAGFEPALYPWQGYVLTRLY